MDAATVFLDYALYRIEPQPRTLSNAFSSEKGFKDMCPYFRRDSGAVIANFDHHTPIVAVGPDPELALTVHRVNRVINEICPDLIELATEGVYEEGDGLIVTLNRNATLEFVIQDRQSRLKALHNVHILHRRLVHICVFLDSPDQVGNSGSAALDFMQKGGNLNGGSNSDQSRPCGTGVKVFENGFQCRGADTPLRQLGRELPQIILAVAAEQRINPIFKVRNREGVGWGLIALNERRFQFLFFCPLRGSQVPPAKFMTRVLDTLQSLAELRRRARGCVRGIVELMSKTGGKLSQSGQPVALLLNARSFAHAISQYADQALCQFWHGVDEIGEQGGGKSENAAVSDCPASHCKLFHPGERQSSSHIAYLACKHHDFAAKLATPFKFAF